MAFRIQSFESRYQPEVLALIEKIQVGEFNIPIEGGATQGIAIYLEVFSKRQG